MKKLSSRQKILESALKLFSQNGYQGATTREIAREAGVAELTLFRHFKTKEGLFNEVLKEYSVLPALKGLIPQVEELGYYDALHLIAHTFLHRLMERADLIRILHSEVHLYPEKVRKIHEAVIRESHETIAEYFKRQQAKGAIADFDPTLGARAFLGMFFAHVHSLRFLPVHDPGRLDTEKVITQYVNLFAHGTTNNARTS